MKKFHLWLGNIYASVILPFMEMLRWYAQDTREFVRGMATNVYQNIKEHFGHFRFEYWPFLTIYMAQGLHHLPKIALTAWIYNQQGSITGAMVAVVAFWVGVPGTVKMVIAQFPDSIRIFGSGRRIYIFFGACFLAIGYGALYALAMDHIPFQTIANHTHIVTPYLVYALAIVIAEVGFVLQDVIADAMSTEVVDRTDARGNPRPEKEVEAELGQVQWLCRILKKATWIPAAWFGGWLLGNDPHHIDPAKIADVFLLCLVVVPQLSILGVLLAPPKHTAPTPINWEILGGGVLLMIFVIAIETMGIAHSEEIIFMTLLGLVSVLGWRIGLTKPVALALVAVFAFNASPKPGEAVKWWQMNDLQFSPQFLGGLEFTGAIATLLGILFLKNHILKKPLHVTLVGVTVAYALMTLPDLILFYKLNETPWGTIEPRHLAYFDAGVTGALSQLAALPILTLIAKSCPEGRAATWFALLTSMTNLGYQFGAILTKQLNMYFGITQASYGNLGRLMIVCWLIALVMPLTATYFCLHKNRLE